MDDLKKDLDKRIK